MLDNLSALREERDNALSRVRYLKQLLAHARPPHRSSLVERLHQAEHVLDTAECRLAAASTRERVA